MEKDMRAGATSRPIENIAVIGVGSMGSHMAGHIRRAGFSLTICDRSEHALEAFSGLGVTLAHTPADCGSCDAVIILVATPEQLREVAFGTNGLISLPPEQMPRYIVVSSTVAPADMQALVDGFEESPIRIVDAPISGGLVGAQKASLTFLVGGEAADVDMLRPLFLSMGRAIFHCGPVGAGQATKTINNIIAISNLLISAEAYTIALANGLAMEHLLPALESGSARNFLSRDASEAAEVYGAWSASPEIFESVRQINKKDIDLALALSPEGSAFPAISLLRALLDDVGPETLDHWRTIGASNGGQAPL